MEVNEFVMANEKVIRLGAFFGILGVMALWEILAPRRALTVSKAVRWINNLGIVFFNTFLVWLIFPVVSVGMALFASQQGWGIFNYFELPFWLTVVISIVVLDFIIYLQHVMVHAVPALWRLHRVHHADLDYDVTIGVCFHFIEIILSMLIKFVIIIVLGLLVVAVVIFEVILNAMVMFNHGNISLPKVLDRMLCWLVVTSDMHCVYHFVEDNEANSNYGFNLSIWDRIFGTYIDQFCGGHLGMMIGIHKWRH